MFFRLFCVSAAALVALPALAADAPAPAKPPCVAQQQTVGVSATFNMQVKSFSEGKAKFDDKLKQILNVVQSLNVKKTKLISSSMNIDQQPNNYNDDNGLQFQMSGSVSYELDSTDNAVKVAEALSQKKFQVNLDSNQSINNACDSSAGN